MNAIETYVVKHNVENSKYYLAQVDDEFCSLICDVTENTEQIYQKLAEPFQILEDER